MVTKMTFQPSETTRLPTAPLLLNQMAMHADRNMAFTNQINQIRNIDTLHDEDVIAKSADAIKAFLRKTIAAQSYGKMFATGSRFKDLNQAMPPFKGKANFQALDHLDKLSQHYLREIKTKTPNLNADEKRLLAQIVDSPITLRHQSNKYLASNGKLNVFSCDKINKMAINSTTNTKEDHKIQLSNHDFVFWAVEFSEDKTAMPLNQTHMSTDFGANAYLIDNTYPHGYLTLTDHLSNYMNMEMIEHKGFADQFPQSLKKIVRYVSNGENCQDVPIFAAKDMKLGLGLHLIHFLRETEDNDLLAFAFQKDLSSKSLDRLLHFIFQPEFHLPRIVSTTNFKTVKLREMSLSDAVKGSNFERLDELVTSKESACEAMSLAIKSMRDDVIQNLFDRFTFIAEDISSMGDELSYRLSGSCSRPSVLKLFMDKGFVDVFSPFKINNKGQTMLDNAISCKNEEMMVFLRNLGVQTKEKIELDLEEAILSSNIKRVNRLATLKKKLVQCWLLPLPIKKQRSLRAYLIKKGNKKPKKA